ncbi:MAG: hypothetical protein ACPG61_17865 [Paracoccaceae bacterium]
MSTARARDFSVSYPTPDMGQPATSRCKTSDGSNVLYLAQIDGEEFKAWFAGALARWLQANFRNPEQVAATFQVRGTGGAICRPVGTGAGLGQAREPCDGAVACAAGRDGWCALCHAQGEGGRMMVEYRPSVRDQVHAALTAEWEAGRGHEFHWTPGNYVGWLAVGKLIPTRLAFERSKEAEQAVEEWREDR